MAATRAPRCAMKTAEAPVPQPSSRHSHSAAARRRAAALSSAPCARPGRAPPPATRPGRGARGAGRGAATDVAAGADGEVRHEVLPRQHLLLRLRAPPHLPRPAPTSAAGRRLARGPGRGAGARAAHQA